MSNRNPQINMFQTELLIFPPNFSSAFPVWVNDCVFLYADQTKLLDLSWFKSSHILSVHKSFISVFKICPESKQFLSLLYSPTCLLPWFLSIIFELGLSASTLISYSQSSQRNYSDSLKHCARSSCSSAGNLYWFYSLCNIKVCVYSRSLRSGPSSLSDLSLTTGCNPAALVAFLFPLWPEKAQFLPRVLAWAVPSAWKTLP